MPASRASSPARVRFALPSLSSIWIGRTDFGLTAAGGMAGSAVTRAHQPPATVVTVLAGLVGWALLTLLERRWPRVRRTRTIVGFRDDSGARTAEVLAAALGATAPRAGPRRG
jgi:uncharacterized membrane protein